MGRCKRISINSSNASNGTFINAQALDSKKGVLYTNGRASGINRVTMYYDWDDEFVSGFDPRKSTVPDPSTIINSQISTLSVSPFVTESSNIVVGMRSGKLVKANITIPTDSDSEPTATWTDIKGASFVGSISDIEYGKTENDLYVTFHNYGVDNVWYSADGGTTWANKEGDLPDMPVRSILYNPLADGEVIIGTDLGVWYTKNFNDASPNWVQGNNGMTQVRVTDLEMRDDYKVFASTYGRGIFSSQFKETNNDSEPPTVAITSTTSGVTDGSTTNDATIALAFTVSETTSDFAAEDISVSNGTISSFAGSGTSYTATFTPADQGACTIDVAADTFTDAASNNNTVADQFNWTFDNVVPTVTIASSTSGVSDNSTTNNATIALTFTVSETTSDFASEDITVSNGTISSFAGTGTSYTATFTPAAQGACTIDIAKDKFTDAASNNNTAADQFNWTFDNIVPTVTNVTSTKADGTYTTFDIIPITVAFSEDVDVTGTPQLILETSSSNTWTGPNITFTKADGADPTVEANQDRITSNVWITRGNTGGQIFNIKEESVSNNTNSPTGTKWAIGTIDQKESLTFQKFRTAVGKPKDVVGKNLVMYLEDDDIYLSVKFTSWSQQKNGGFTYERSTSNGAIVDYSSGSGTNTLTFNYTVADGDSSPDLDYVYSNPIVFNGGTIKDAALNNS